LETDKMIYALMTLGFALVIFGASLLVSGASALAKRLRVSDLVIGLTVVAFGTSLPELAVNVASSIKGTSGITLGNILGSNIANVLLILGASGMIFPLVVTKSTISRGIPLSLLAALLVGILANDHLIDSAGSSALGRIDGLVLICFFVVFMYYAVSISEQVPGMNGYVPSAERPLSCIFTIIAAGLACLIVGSKWIVEGATSLASMLGVSQSVIGLTIVALGTSLPELTTSAVAAYKKNPEIAVGNVVGSNIFNIFFILGLSSLIRPIPFEAKANIDVGVTVVASLLLFFAMLTGKRRVLDRWEGAFFVALYFAYSFFLVILSGKL
jgi:cation:H+ antiporter